VEAAFITVSGLNVHVMPLVSITFVQYVLSIGLMHILALALLPSPWPCFFCKYLASIALPLNTKVIENITGTLMLLMCILSENSPVLTLP